MGQKYKFNPSTGELVPQKKKGCMKFIIWFTICLIVIGIILYILDILDILDYFQYL